MMLIQNIVKNCMGKSKMAKISKISLNNGCSFKSYNDLSVDDIDYIHKDWDNIVSYMDDKTREEVHSELAPCSELDFLKRYLEIAKEDLVIG